MTTGWIYPPVCFLCLWYVLESAVSVEIAGLVFGVHELVCEWVEFVESLFESGFWNSLCVEDDPCQGDNDSV